MRAAIAALPFERPKLAVTAHVGGSFADQLEARIARLGKPIERSGEVIEGQAEQLEAGD